MRVFLLFLLIASFAFSQEKTFSAEIVIDQRDFAPEGIYVKNLRSGNFALTDLLGSFEIKVVKGDTLVFSSYNVETRKIKISEYFYSAENPVIHLTPKAIELAELRIWNQGLTGYLDEDLKRISKELAYDPVPELYQSLGINPDTEVGKASLRPLGFRDINPFRINIGRIFDVVSGDYRRKMLLYTYEKREERILEVRAYFGEDFFERLKIPENKIRELIEYAFLSEGLDKSLENYNYFEGMRILEKSAEEFRKRLQIEPTGIFLDESLNISEE